MSLISTNPNSNSSIRSVWFSGNEEQVEHDSGILSTSNFSSLSEVELEFKNVPKQENTSGNGACKSSNFVIEELKKKIVQLNVELSKSNQENLKLKTDTKFQKNQLDYLKHYLDWHKKICSKFQNENSRLKNKDLQQEIELVKSKSLQQNLEWDNQKWIQKFELIKLESSNKCRLLQSKLETLENKMKLDELYAQTASEKFVSITNSYNLETEEAQMKINVLENQLKISKANIQTLKDEVSELCLKNINLENILGKKNIDIEKLQQMVADEHLKQESVSCNENLDVLKMRNVELNKMVQMKNIEIKDKVRKYETSIRTLLRKIKEYKSSRFLFVKKCDKLQIELKTMTTQFENIMSENVDLNMKLLITSAIMVTLKKNNFNLQSEVIGCKNMLKIFKEKNLSGDYRNVDLKNIDLLIEKSDHLDKQIYQNDDVNKEFNLLNCLIKTMKTQIANKR